MQGLELPPGELPHIAPSAAPALTLRPTFSLELERPSDGVIEALRLDLRQTALDVRWAKVPGRGQDSAGRPHCHAMIAVPSERQHVWSPWLFLDVHPVVGDLDRTEIVGRFTPHPSVWTGFAFGYLVLGLLAMAGLVGAFAQWSLGKPPELLGLIALSVALALVLWGSARAGQRLAHVQMDELRAAILHAVQPTHGSNPERQT